MSKCTFEPGDRVRLVDACFGDSGGRDGAKDDQTQHPTYGPLLGQEFIVHSMVGSGLVQLLGVDDMGAFYPWRLKRVVRVKAGRRP